MPHLSPMSWIISIITFWLTLSMLASTMWWSKHHSFNSKSKYASPTLLSYWNWV
uniref:ATP synthase F0 subunit 8 n=1 Tax=Eisenia nordenskioldi nordenskioldi TaxID=1269247 RepID=A0A6B9ISF7_9ANNE|nr:ATP synthase F0 subunit 8 [Eisenia nordenskioldi nordenskioldi]UWM94621.1 ATP synthase F0 subunit 8 [Eisenia nordenskioldi]UWM94634.1 ATP synthase F0 subunit 8 [Eisenia nordenskioldi]UWM94647.1 ATP synthase F0 subunit 8 [Eisenia nordenskioldi]UWM94660.1 ATP synthase F0 subunit 8 [Eisenia nordenskioldi]